MLVDDGRIFDVSVHTKEMGVVMPVGISASLYREISPWAEDIIAGESYMERLEQLIKGFKKEFRHHDAPYGEFYVKSTSRVAEIVNPGKDRIEARTHADGKKVDKVVHCFVGLLPKGKRPGIIFGIKGETGPLPIKEGVNNVHFGKFKPR